MPAPRLAYAQSCEQLRAFGWFDASDPLPMPPATPRYDDDLPFGVHFFRTRVDGTSGHSFAGLTLPRTYVGRSHVGSISFANTDLSESCLCWSDFEDVDFTDADLTRADLRASNYAVVRFVQAKLAGADLRHATFTDCDFDGADLTGAKLSRRDPGLQPPLSPEQAATIDWQPEAGPIPGGG